MYLPSLWWWRWRWKWSRKWFWTEYTTFPRAGRHFHFINSNLSVIQRTDSTSIGTPASALRSSSQKVTSSSQQPLIKTFNKIHMYCEMFDNWTISITNLCDRPTSSARYRQLIAVITYWFCRPQIFLHITLDYICSLCTNKFVLVLDNLCLSYTSSLSQWTTLLPFANSMETVISMWPEMTVRTVDHGSFLEKCFAPNDTVLPKVISDLIFGLFVNDSSQIPLSSIEICHVAWWSSLKEMQGFKSCAF